MSLGKKILEFFSREKIERSESAPKLGQLIDECLPEGYIAVDVQSALNKLLFDSYIVSTGFSWDFNLRNNTYQTLRYNPIDADYGVYDFIIYGFKKIHDNFQLSVKPIINIIDRDLHIGTGFLLNFNGHKCFITARHCIDNGGTVIVYDSKNNIIVPKSIYLTEKTEFTGDAGFEYQNLDVCIMTFDEAAFGDEPFFVLDKPEIVNDVMVLGFPPTGLFDSGADVNNAVLIAEKASIAHTYIKATLGQNVGSGMLPTTKLDYLLVSTRVKGGNSGGPVINNKGKVIGIITQIPMDGESSTSDKIDNLGFGFACPSQLIELFLNSIFCSTGDIKFIEKTPIVQTEGFTI